MKILLHSLFIRRLTCISLAACLLVQSLHAQSGYAVNGKKKGIFGLFSQNDNQNQPSAKQTLFNVLKDLNRQKGVYFLFSDPSIGSRQVNAVDNSNAAIEKILEQVLKNTGIKYKKVSDNTFVILYSKENPKKAEKSGIQLESLQASQDAAGNNLVNSVNDVITGRITGSDGNPVAGVSISVKGTRRGTATNADGEFSIEANKGEILVISSVGYVTQEVVVSDEARISIRLVQSDSQMSEIVVTALGIRKEAKRLGYAVSKVEGEGLTKAREMNVANGLVGRVAGLNVSSVAGGPGSSTNIVIRGVNSFSGGSPLFVINGVPMDNSPRGSAGMWGGADLGDGISNINPDDIEEISILKGSTASALYGSRASNGVILITTKSGKDKKGIGIEFNSNLVMDDIIDHTEYQYVYGQGLLGVKPGSQSNAYISGANSWGAKIDNSNAVQFDGVTRPYSANKDNIKNFYRTGHTLTNTIAFSGGNENGNFRLSASNLLNKSVVPNSGMRRNTFNLNLNSKLTPKLTLSTVVNYIIEKSKNRPNLSDSPGNSNFGIAFLPTTVNESILRPGFKPDGAEINFSDNIYVTNPWFAANAFVNDLSRNRVITMAMLKYDFTSWLSLQGRIGQDYYNDRTTSVTPTGTAYAAKGGMTENSIKFTELNADVLLSAARKLSDDFELDVSVGGNLLRAKSEIHNSTGDQFNVPFLYALQNANNRNTRYDLLRREVQSVYYTAELGYKGMLYLNTTGREDWFSTLPIENNHLFYPSVSASFVFSEVLKASWLNYGKLRLAWANTSGQAEPYQTKLYYSIDGSVNGYPIGVNTNTNVPNSQLEPFRLKETEVGLELRTLGSRLGLDVAWFNRQVIKEIISVPASPTSGYQGATINFGELENKGVELMLTGTPVKTKSLTWTSSFNITKLNNKVLKLSEGQSSLQMGESRSRNAYIHHVVGKPASQIMAFDYKRDASGNPIFDANGRPLQGLLIPMGAGFHDVFGGWFNEVNYKGLNFSVLIDFKSGGKIFSATNYYATIFGLHQMTLEGREGGVVGNGVNESGGKNTVSEDAWDYYGALATNVSSTFVYDASFIKLRQIVLGYNLPAKWFSKIGVQGVNVSLVARNLAVLKKNTPNIDPESNYNSSVAQGLELAGVPPFRSYGLNINFKF
ncbi:MAG TPA: SusC/RagA family TonB-linked outer membrane protein [Chitinophagaceae bacterium]